MKKPTIDVIESRPTAKIYYMHQDISGLELYDRTKAIERFINNATKTLETLLSADLRHFLRLYGIIPQDGSEKSLEKAINELELKGYELVVIDRYYQLGAENIIAESPNHMTVIYEEENLLGCSMEVRIDEIH